MATVKLPPNTWVDQVINLGMDKKIPFGAVNVVYSKDTGASVGFVRGGKFYKMGQKLDKTSSITPEASFSIDDLNKNLPDGGIDIHHVSDYLNSTVPQLADAAHKIIGLQSLGVWDMNGKPTNSSDPSNFANFGKIHFTQADVDAKLAQINQAKQVEANNSATEQQKANDSAKTAGRALPFPNLSSPSAVPVTSLSGVKGAVGSPTQPQITPNSSTPSNPAPQTTATLIQGLLRDSQVSTPKSVKKNPPVGTGTGAGGIGTKGVKIPAAPPLSQQDFLTKYRTTLAFIQSDPSLTKLFNDASKGNWPRPKFAALLKETSWAHKFSAQAQQQELARTQSPSTFGSSWNNMRNLIATTAVSLGLNIRPQDVGNELKPTGTGGVWQAKDVPRQDGTITQWALEHANDQNFQQELQQHLTTVGNINLNMPGGTAGTDIQALKKYAASMGLLGYQLPSATDPNNPNSKGMDYFSSAAQSILLGKSDMQTWQSDMLAQAKGRYKSFASSLDAGQTVQNLAAPYINTLANLLEISPDKVDLSSPTGYGKMVNDALMGTDATNQIPMNLTDFEKQIKARPEWGYTNNARDTLMPGVDSLLKTLGKVS